MSVVQQVRDKVKEVEGAAEVWIVSKKTAIITHGSVFAGALWLGWHIAKHYCK